jgi:hypothetical protein
MNKYIFIGLLLMQNTAYTLTIDPQSGYRGRMILLIDNTITTPLSTEIEQLKTDLIGDGWFVETIEAQRVAGWNGGQAVTVVKQQIVNVYNAAPTNDKSKLLFILGHVPVARSGLALEAADGHPENEGALASDAYYAEMVILMSGLVSDYLALY